MRVNITLTLFLCLAAIWMPGFAQSLPNVTEIVGQSKQIIDTLFGAPEFCEKSDSTMECRYARGQTIIFYVDEKARWLRIQDTGGIPFEPKSIVAFGLKEMSPQKKAPSLISWTDLPGFRIVSFTSHDFKTISLAYFE